MQTDRAPGVSRRLDAVPGLIVAALLVALVTWDPVVAGRLVREDSLVEWLQVVGAAVALGFVLAALVRRWSAADVVLAVLLCAMIASEIELDQRIFGIPVVDPRFFRLATVPFAVKVIAGALVIGLPLGLAVYTVRHWRDLWAEARVAARDGWLPPLVVAVVFIAIAQAWERELNYVLPLPKYFLEESLEVLGMTYLALGMGRRLRAARRSAEQPEPVLLPRARENVETD